MSLRELEKRVEELEQQVKELSGEIGRRRERDWRVAVEECRGDEDVLSVIREGMKLREKERRAVRRKWVKKRRSSS